MESPSPHADRDDSNRDDSNRVASQCGNGMLVSNTRGRKPRALAHVGAAPTRAPPAPFAGWWGGWWGCCQEALDHLLELWSGLAVQASPPTRTTHLAVQARAPTRARARTSEEAHAHKAPRRQGQHARAGAQARRRRSAQAPARAWLASPFRPANAHARTRTRG